jgi:hypothetical protein
MSYEPSDYSKGFSGYAPPFGASNEWYNGLRAREAGMSSPSTSLSSTSSVCTSFSPGSPSEAPDGIAIVAFVEALLLGGATTLFCWLSFDLGLFSLPLGIAAAMGYFFLSTRKATIFWMMIPRMVAWNWLAVSIARSFGADLGWRAFCGGLAVAIVVWNTGSAQEQLDKNK